MKMSMKMNMGTRMGMNMTRNEEEYEDEHGVKMKMNMLKGKWLHVGGRLAQNADRMHNRCVKCVS